jgi:hypothetical protein
VLKEKLKSLEMGAVHLRSILEILTMVKPIMNKTVGKSRDIQISRAAYGTECLHSRCKNTFSAKELGHRRDRLGKGDSDPPQIEAQWKLETKRFYPDDISAIGVAKRKNIPETQSIDKVTEAVVSVPCDFNDGQRQATKDGGVIAELNVP